MLIILQDYRLRNILKLRVRIVMSLCSIVLMTAVLLIIDNLESLSDYDAKEVSGFIKELPILTKFY